MGASREVLIRVAKLRKEYELLEIVPLSYVTGLPFPDGGICWVGIAPDKFVFLKNDTVVTLPMERVVDVFLDASGKATNHYVSDAGGAVAGGMLFGAVGAAIGGGTKKITEYNISMCFAIMYKDGDGIGNILFDVRYYPKHKKILKIYKKLPKQQTVIHM